ncbi:MAG: hypothetical protein J2P25_02005 [Nocardiopsaceae bacterium]|nr:hypothetical protein [Nocardiopsaceae bacterium]
MITDEDLAAKVSRAFSEQAQRSSPAGIDAASIFRRGRRRRHRQLATRAVSVAAAVGLVAGVVVAGTGSLAPGRGTQPSSAGKLPGNTLLDAKMAPKRSAAAADIGQPKYYIVDSDPKLAALEVRSSVTGKVVSTVSPPSTCDPKSFQLAAAGNDRDFVFACSGTGPDSFYRLQLNRDGAASALTPLSIPGHVSWIGSMALSADGTKLAFGLQGPNKIEVVTLATGAVQTWSIGSAPFDVSWGDHGREVGFTGDAGLYVINASEAGGSPRLVLPTQVNQDEVQSAILSPDGNIIAAVDYQSADYGHLNRNAVVGGIVEISPTTGKPLRTLLAMHNHNGASCELGAIDATGHHLLVSCDQFGRLDYGRFTPLPGPGPQDALYTSAW